MEALKAQTFKDVATVNLKTEALLAKAMILLGVDSLEITQEDMQNARKWMLGLSVGPGECKATLRGTSSPSLAVGCHRSHPHENMSEECLSATEKVRRAFGLSPATQLEEVLDNVFDRR